MTSLYPKYLLTLVCLALTLLGCGDAVESDPIDDGAPAAGSEVSGEDSTSEASESAQAPADVPTQDIAEILESDPRFSEVLALVNRIGLLDVMRTAGPFTVFVPVNEAVQAVPSDTMDRVLEEQGFLHRFILVHVAEGDHSAESLNAMTAMEMIGGVSDVVVTDGELVIGGALVIEQDILATNGRLHALDTVIPMSDEAESE